MKQIGLIKYDEHEVFEISMAVSNATGLMWDLNKETIRTLLDTIYFKHFDIGVVEDAKELEKILIEDHRL